MRPFDHALLLQALAYAADKHRHQRRKGGEQVPYINHPIEVAEVLVTVGEVEDVVTLSAALLHDTIEDTNASAAEIEAAFGAEVLGVVLEVTDDKSLRKKERKRLQVELAHTRSHRARTLILADKICNIRDLGVAPLPGWSNDRMLEYFEWAKRVVTQIEGTNAPLEALFAQLHEAGLRTYEPTLS